MLHDGSDILNDNLSDFHARLNEQMDNMPPLTKSAHKARLQLMSFDSFPPPEGKTVSETAKIVAEHTGKSLDEIYHEFAFKAQAMMIIEGFIIGTNSYSQEHIESCMRELIDYKTNSDGAL